ncbi:MAG: DUF2283 domain-containing protein [bacterium]
MGKIEFDKSVIPYLLKIADRPFWVDYDSETDTLYISFRKPQKANDSIMEEGMIYHYDEDDLVGITVLNAESYSKN